MFTPASARPAALFKWHASLGVSASCLHGTWKSPAGSSKIAAFDIDGTIIKTKTGNTFPSSKDDWKLWSANVKAKLKEAHDQGSAFALSCNESTLIQPVYSFAIVLLSNQGESDISAVTTSETDAKIQGTKGSERAGSRRNCQISPLNSRSRSTYSQQRTRTNSGSQRRECGIFTSNLSTTESLSVRRCSPYHRSQTVADSSVLEI